MRKGKLLSKVPCNDDLFEGGAHRKLAIEIADEICHDDNCTIIGIDGGWGSGKSNLVGMIQKELSSGMNGGKYHFFTYDAWGHQTDLQRRTILEELTSDLVKGQTPILNENSWKDSLENLLAKKKHTSTKTIPAIGIGSIVSMFSILLTPFVTHLASLVSVEWLKQAVLVIPYVAAYGFFGYRHYGKMKDKYKQAFTWEKCLSEFFLIYKDDIKEETKFETISEKEPSSRQFKEWIHEIDNSLKQNDDIVLVLVIDNMDRLPKQKVQELWAAIHSCFSEEKYTNIRIIVPFDRLHIRNAFQSENLIRQCDGKDNAITVYGDDFINKTFYIVYTVPPPILSGWMHYFKDRWKEAFGNSAIVDYSVLQVYDMLTKEQSPRKIIAFINQFVTIRNLCDERIEDKYIALYIFGRSKIIENPLEEILNPSYLQGLNFLYSDDENMASNISSLYYQLSLDKAMDVVFTREVTAELDDNNVKVLDQLRGNANYWEILNHSITAVSNIENAALALEKHFGDNSSHEASLIWDALYMRSNPGSATRDKQYEEYHCILLKHISEKKEYYAHLLTVYHANIYDGFDLQNYINGIDKLHEFISEEDRKTSDRKTIISPKQYLQLVDSRKDNFDEYGLVVDNEKMDDYLVSLDINELADMKFYPLLKNDVKLPKYKKEIEQQFAGNTSNLQIEAKLLCRLKEIALDDKPIDISDYINDNEIYNMLNALSKDDELYPDVLGMAISRYSSGNAYIRGYLQNSIGTLTEEQTEKVSSCIEYYIYYGDLLLQLDDFSAMQYVADIARKLTTSKYGVSTMNVKKALVNYDTIHENLKLESHVILTRFNDWKKYISSVTLKDVPSLSINLVRDMKNSSELQISKHCLGMVEEYLESLDQEAWKHSLVSNDYNFKLLFVYHPKSLAFFIDAFKEIMRDYALGHSNTSISNELTEKTITILTDMGYDSSIVFKEVRDIFVNNSCINKDKLKYFVKWLFLYGNLEGSKKSLNKILRSEFLDDPEILKLVLENKSVVKQMMKKADDTSDFTNKLSALTKQHEDDDELKSLCSYWGIDIDGSK